MSSKSLRQTILRLSHHYTDASKLLKAVREAHPECSKKDVILACFETMIEAASSDKGLATTLHRAVMDHRNEE